MSIDLSEYDEECLRHMYNREIETGAIPYIDWDQYKSNFKMWNKKWLDS